MITLELPFFNTVRLATAPDDYGYVVEENLAVALPANPSATLVNECVIVEWLSRRGGHFLYGLLGARAHLTGGGAVELQVAVGTNHDPMSRATLASTLERPHIGLPREYGHAVMNSATAALSKACLPASSIQFVDAVYGEVGSSELVFGRLAEVVVRLLSLPIAEDDTNLSETIGRILLR